MFLGINIIYTPVYLPLCEYGQNQPPCADVGLLLNMARTCWFHSLVWAILRSNPPSLHVGCPRGIFSHIHPSVDIQECISNRVVGQTKSKYSRQRNHFFFQRKGDKNMILVSDSFGSNTCQQLDLSIRYPLYYLNNIVFIICPEEYLILMCPVTYFLRISPKMRNLEKQ